MPDRTSPARDPWRLGLPGLFGRAVAGRGRSYSRDGLGLDSATADKLARILDEVTA